jgi:hypothetical protein
MLLSAGETVRRVLNGGPLFPVRIENAVLQNILSSWIFVTLLVAIAVTASVGAIVGPVVGTWCGWRATSRLRRQAANAPGLRLAVAEALFYPLALIWLTVYVMWSWIHGVLGFHQDASQTLSTMLSFLVAAASLSAGAAWLLWRTTNWSSPVVGRASERAAGPTAVAPSS